MKKHASGILSAKPRSVDAEFFASRSLRIQGQGFGAAAGLVCGFAESVSCSEIVWREVSFRRVHFWAAF